MFNSKAKTLKECPLYQARMQGFVCYEEIGGQDGGEGGGQDEGEGGGQDEGGGKGMGEKEGEGMGL